VVYAITSLSPQRASAQQLLELNRGHWRIENQLHWVRDVVMGEDKCRARKGHSPQNLAALHNLGLSILRFQGIKSIQSTIRHFAMKPLDLLKTLRILN
jgi:predicted transposase YbfD/YdcC